MMDELSKSYLLASVVVVLFFGNKPTNPISLLCFVFVLAHLFHNNIGRTREPIEWDPTIPCEPFNLVCQIDRDELGAIFYFMMTSMILMILAFIIAVAYYIKTKKDVDRLIREYEELSGDEQAIVH